MSTLLEATSKKYLRGLAAVSALLRRMFQHRHPESGQTDLHYAPALIDERQSHVLKAVCQKPGSSCAEIFIAVGKVGVGRHAIYSDLRRLIEDGKVRKEGSTRWTRYYPK